MHAISLFVCWWFANGTLLHAFCTFSFWTKSKPLNWNRRREKNMKGASELYWTKWSMLSGLTVYEQEKGREKGVRESPLYLFFFLSPSFFSTVKCICLQPLCSAHKAVWRLKTCFLYVRFSRCDMQGNCYFLPPTVVYGKQVSKTPPVSKVNLIKVAKWKVHALIFPSLGCVWEFEICSCDSGSQFFSFFFFFSLLWSANVQNVCNSRHKKSRWISQLNRTIIKLYRHTELWGVQPNYYSFEKHWCYSGLIQNGRRCQEYICFLNSECTTHAGKNFARFVGQRSVVPSVVTLNWWHWLTVGVRNEHFSSTQRKSLKSNIQAISPFENWLLVFPLSRVMNIPWESEQHD